MVKNLISRPVLAPQNFFVGFTSARCYSFLSAITVCNFNLILGTLGRNLGNQNSFFKSLASTVTRYHVQLSLRTISEKTNDPILRKFSARQTESDFIGRCPINVESPTISLS